jgi:3'-phosphoadenosine 5'-phosphosulfate (PAPS) 3'-phosphatase
MAMRKTMKKMRKTMKKMRVKRSRRKQSRLIQSRRKNKNTKRKMRGGEGEVQEMIEKYQTLHVKEEILKTCLDACDALQPFIQRVYDLLKTGENLSATKTSDTDIFTIADGMVQYILRTYLFDNYENFVGEEEVKVVEPKTEKDQYILFEKDKKFDIPDIFTTLIHNAIKSIKNLKLSKDNLKPFTIFLDPIDGTSEFKKGKGEQCTILIGFADNEEVDKEKEKYGKAMAGLAYRPVINDKNKKNTYAYGWIDENGKGHVKKYLNMSNDPTDSNKIRFITSNSPTSDITNKLIDKIGVRVSSGGAGNKIMMLLENKGDVYLQDRGVSRWDTCAGEAILRAKGGLLCKLTEFEKTGMTDSHYIYKKVDDNINPDPNDDAEYGTQNHFVDEDGNKHFNPTNNLCGLVAITGEKKEKGLLKTIYETIEQLKKEKTDDGLKFLKFEYN